MRGSMGGARRRAGTARAVALAACGVMIATGALTTGALVAGTGAAQAAVLPTPAPPEQRPADSYTADNLPTVQIDDGVVWSQAIVGNTVYAGGDFRNARPFGTTRGQQLTRRANLLAYDVRTGELITAFDQPVDGVVKVVRASPDGKRVYIGGTFTQVAGQPRYNVAAFDVATGALVADFKPVVAGGYVNAIAATPAAVYFGGSISSVNGTARTNLGAVDVLGNLLNWKPTADRQVDSMVVSPSADNKLIIAGRFGKVNNTAQLGMAAVGLADGSLLSWQVNTVIKNGNSASAGIYEVTTDGKLIYGTAWQFGGTANLEGSFSVEPATGKLNTMNWVEGDEYSTYSDGRTQYAVGHPHMSSMIGGWGNYATDMPNGGPHQYAMAFTSEARGTVASGGYWNHSGKPAPAIVDWYPRWYAGTYTGQGQAGWSITGNKDYLVVGGEFQGVNGDTQYGLTRFARDSVGASKSGPRESGAGWGKPTFTANPGGGRVTIRTTWDRDDRNLTYQLYRSGAAAPVASTVVGADSWNRGTVKLADTSAEPGTTATYTVRAVDSDGNWADSATVTGTASSTAIGDYAKGILADGPSLYWRLGGSQPGFDWAGSNDGTVTSVSSAAGGALTGDTSAWGGASSFASAGSLIATPARTVATEAGSVELWFRTSSSTGGELVGYSTAGTNAAESYRTLFLRADGKLTFGVTPDAGERRTATSRIAYNDGGWHHVVATIGAKGMLIYVDGALVGSNVSATSAGLAQGFWRLGGDTLTGWPGAPTAGFFAGDLDEFAAYDKALTKGQVVGHYTSTGRAVGGGGAVDAGGDGVASDAGGSSAAPGPGDHGEVPAAPDDAYGSVVYAAAPDLFWRLDDVAGTNPVADASGNRAVGSVLGNVTLGGAGRFGTAASLPGNSGAIAGRTQVTNPNTFTETAWFRTSSKTGGRILGFGNSNTGLSGTYDRLVWIQNDGRLVFGVYSGGQRTVTSTAAYNDGAWHQVAASLGADGMKLYVDGAQVASNASITAGRNAAGYWKVGADYCWSGATSSYLNGAIDEAAIYSRVLSAKEIGDQYAVGNETRRAPRPVIDLRLAGATATLDASGSTVAAGRTASYAWNFGDGTTGAGVAATHTYARPGTYPVTLEVTDSDGVTAAATAAVRVDYYGAAVRAGRPDLYWRFNDPVGAGTVVNSVPGAPDGKVITAPVFARDGAIAGSGSMVLTGESGAIVDPRQVNAPSSYSISAWVRTTSTKGGRVIGLAGSATGFSTSYDRELYLRSDGKVTFFTYPAGATMVTSTKAVNDGAWHLLFATQGSDGMKLYLDGVLAASDANAKAQNTKGYWKVGNDNVWTGAGTDYLIGAIDEAAVYSRVVPAAEIAALVKVANGQQPPTATFSQTVKGYAATFDAAASTVAPGERITAYEWSFGDGETATGATAAHRYARPGSYTVTLRVVDSAGMSATASAVVRCEFYAGAVRAAGPELYYRLNDAVGAGEVLDSSARAVPGKVGETPAFGRPGAFEGNAGVSFGSSGFVAAPTAVTNPNAFTTMAWFRTTSKAGGRIIGFGNSATARSANYDRMVWLQSDGKLAFGVNSGSKKTLVSPAAYNDGAWHFVAASLGPDGMVLYVDGRAVASNPAVTTGQNYTGYWKLGYDYVWTGASTERLDGTIDEAAVFARPLPASDIANLYAVADGASVPTAAFTPTVRGATVAVDAAASTAGEGRRLVSYAWDFGDGNTGTGATTSHSYVEIGDFPVTLRVTDDQGLVGTSTRMVSVDSPHNPPIAAIAAKQSGLKVDFDANGTVVDDEARVTGFAWDFGDGATGAGATPSHAYAAAGIYTVRLTATDNFGNTGTTTAALTVSATIAQDTFSRISTVGWGAAEVGGTWQTDAGMSVSDDVGVINLTAQAMTRSGWLTGTNARDIDQNVDISLAKLPSGGSTLVSAVARHTSAGDYRVKFVFATDRSVSVSLVKFVDGKEIFVKSGVLPDRYGLDDVLRVHFQVISTDATTTALKVKVWLATQTEPAGWFLSGTDTEPTLRAGGQLGIVAYLSGAATNLPQAVKLDNLLVVSP